MVSGGGEQISAGCSHGGEVTVVGVGVLAGGLGRCWWSW